MPLIDYRFLEKFLPQAKIKKSFKRVRKSYLNRIRWATSLFFFGMGFCFSSWASRIPDFKSFLHLSEADLGSLLFALPIGQLVAMPFSGKIVTKYGSRTIVLWGILFYSFCLSLLGLATTIWELTAGLFLFGFCGNFCNIAVNTQGIYTQQLFKKPIMGSFHGAWSLAGFAGALVALIMLYFNLTPFYHFLIVCLFVLIIAGFNYKFLIKTKPKIIDGAQKYSLLKTANKSLIWLGIISFCCMASEGIMFDWSGVYFKEIVKAPNSLVVLGYTSFMVTMAAGRFLSDILVEKFGSRKVLIVSGFVITIGLYTAVLFPFLISCTLAFMLVGFGVSNVVPIIFNTAGNTKNVPAGIALTIVSSIGFLGFLIGPPIIGYIAELTSLKYSFALIGMLGVFISILAKKLKIFE